MFYTPPHTLEADQQDGLPSRASMAQAFLRFKFWEYSEDIFMAGWVHELEFLLWDHLQGNAQHAAFDGPGLPEEDIQTIRDLAKLADGWWIWSKDSKEPIFIEMEKWLPIFNQWKSQVTPLIDESPPH